MTKLKLDRLCKGWDFPVLDEVSLEIAEGEFFVIVGPSGAGKTTMLRLIAGLEAPDAGSIVLDGEVVNRVPPYRRGAAMTFESYALYPQLTVFENIASPLRSRKTPAAEVAAKVRKVAELLRISELLERRPGEISGGQKQRTALGRTLVASPKVFLLDEPLSHLDAKIRIDLREQFHTLEELRRTATLYVTHDYAEALSLGDRVGVLFDGKIQQVGRPEEIFERPCSVTVAEQFGQPGINLIDVEFTEADGQLAAAAGALSLPVSAAHRAALTGRAKAKLGVRPQHMQAAPGAGGAFEGRVSSFQSLGSYGVLALDCQGVALRALAEPEAPLSAGDVVHLTADPARFVWFDEQGAAIEV